MANLSIKIKVDDSEVNGLASKIKSAINGINFDMDKGQIARMGSQLENAFSNISVDINTSSAMNKIESLQSAVSQLETNMKDLKIGFNMDDIKAGDIISELNKQTKQGMEVKAIEDYKKSLTQANDLRKKLKDDTISEHTRSQYSTELNQMEASNKRTEKLFNEQYKARLSQRKEMTDFQRDLDREYESFNPTKDIRDNAKQSNDYIKQYQKNLKDISKHQQLLDKSAEGSASYKANQSMIDSLKKDQADIAQSLEKEMKIDISTDDATSKLQNILKLQEEVSRASQTDKEVADYAKDINKLESERVKLAKQAEDAKFKGNEGTSAELTNQSKAINNQIQDLKQAGTAWDNFTDSQKNAMNQTKQQSDNEINNAKKLREARQVDNQAMEKAKQQAADYKELEKATNDYYKTASKVSELQAKMDSGTNTPKDGERLVEQIAMMDAQKQQMESMRDGIKDVEQYSQAYDKMVKSKDQSLKLDTDRNVNTQKQVAEMREVQNAYKQIEDSMRKVDQLERQKDGAGDNTVKAIENQIQAEERLQQQIRETNNLRENGNDSLEQGTQELKEQLTTQRQADEQLTSAQRIDSRRDANKNKPHGITGRMMDWDNIVPTIDIMDVAREGYQAMRKVYDEVASVDKALVSVRKVVDTNDKEWGSFTDTLYDNATAVGKSATEYASSVGMWAQAGKTLPEAQELAGLSTMGAFVGELSEAQMVDYMSVPLNAFSADMLEAQDILNVMNEVSNNNAVEMDHLGAAYTRAAQTAALSGTSFSELTALIGTAQEATRLGGETIGTSLRQMDVNLGRIATKSTKGLEDKFDFFKDIGVDITDANGEIRSTFDVLEDLQGVWGSLDSVTQRKAAFDLAGARGQAIMSGLMSNWGKVEEMMLQANSQIGLDEGVGSAFDEFAIQTDSLEFKANKLKNTWNEFISETVGGSDTFKGFFDTAIKGVEALESATQNDRVMGFAGSIGKMLGVDLLTNVGLKGIRTFADNANEISESMGDWNKQGRMFSGLAGGTGKMFGGIGKAASVLGKGLGAAGIAVEVFFLADAIGQLFGLDLSGWAKENIVNPLVGMVNPTKVMMDNFKESFAVYEGEMQEFKRISAGLDEVQDIEQDLTVTMNLKREVYNESGNIADLVLSEGEFEELQGRFDNLLSEFNLEGEFELRFNNYDYIMEQLGEVESRIKEIKNDQLRDVIAAETAAFNNILGDSSTFNEYSSLKSERDNALKAYQKDKNRLDELLGKNELGTITDDEAKELMMLEVEIDVKEDSLVAAEQRLQNFLDKEDGKVVSDKEQEMIEESLATATKNRKDMMDGYLTNGEGSDYLAAMDPNSDALNVYLDALTGIAGRTGDIDKLNTAFEDTKGLLGSMNPDNIEEIGKQFSEIWKDLPDVMGDDIADFMKKNGITPGEFSGFLNEEGEIDQGKLTEFINLIGQSKNQYNQHMQDMMAEVEALGLEFGFTAEQVESMSSKLRSGDMAGYTKEMLDAADAAGRIDEALHSLGIAGNTQTTLGVLAGNADISMADYVSDIQSQVSGMDLGVALKLGLAVDESGTADFNKIIQDINAFDKMLGSLTEEERQILVTTELIAEDGSYNLESMYSIIEGINLTSLEKELGIGVSFTPNEDPMVSIQEQIDKGNIELSVDVEGNLVMTNTSEYGEGESVVLTGNVNWEGESYEDYVDALPGEVEHDMTVRPNITYETDIDSDSNDFINGVFDTSGYVFEGLELTASAKVHFETEEGNIDFGKVMGVVESRISNENLQAMIDVQGEIRFDGENMTFEAITDYIALLVKNGQGQEAVEFIQEVFPMFQITGGSQIDNVLQDLIHAETPEEIASNVNNRVDVDTQVNMQAGVGKQIEEEVQGETKGLSVNAPVSIQAQGTVDSVITNEDGLSNVANSLSSIPSNTTATVTIDTGDAEEKIAAVDGLLTTISARTTQVVITGNALHALAQIALVAMIRIPPKTVMINGNAEGFHRVMGGLTGKSVTVDIKGRQSSSNVIGSGSVGALMSLSIGSAMNGMGLNRSSAIGTNRSTETKVNEDVWRYWAQEMYTGNPITNSLDELSSQLKRAGDDYAKIIKITEQQIKLTRQQISHEEEMRRLEQKQIGEILADLRKQGFTTDGNRITNLDRAKTFSGDTASEVDKLLGEWKGLYESINSLDSTIGDLQTDIYNFEQDIRDAREDEEADKLEKTLNRSEALLRAIETNTSIQAQRVEALGAEDYEMSLSVNDSAILSSTQAMQQLIAEFNKMSATTFEFEDNAEDMHGHLEDLRDQILDNADSILEYRDAIDEIRIRRVIDEFDRFAASLSQNADMMSTNIDRLREGLLSGAGLSELGAFSTVDFGQKTQFERDFEERLALEKRLDEALEAYSEANVERIRKASADELRIQQSKYSQLISMVRDYSIGEMGDYSIDYDPKKVKEVSAIHEGLLSSMDKYNTKYQALITKYNNALSLSTTGSQQQSLYNQLILDQLQLQEEYQHETIAQNQLAIAQAQELAKNTSLTTEQKRELLDAVNDYQQNIVDAQQVIRDSISARYEFEFQLMDEATAKYKEYYDSLAYMLNIAELTNASPEALGSIFEAMYGSLISQYDQAKKQLAELTAEQAKLEEGSFEWKLLSDRIKETTQSVKDLGLEALNANKDILDNTLSGLTSFFERGFLDGATLEEWEDYHKNWISGVEKELAIEELRIKSLSLEDDVVRRRLEALDRQDEVSRKELEYLDKQMKLSELEAKLANIEGERDVQTLVRRDDGTFAWEYMADQSDYESTQQEILEAQKALEEFRREQRGGYVSSLGDIIDRAKSGSYDSPEDLQNDLNLLNAVYGSILSDIPGFQNMSLEDIVSAYQKYMSDNAIIAGDMLGEPGVITPESEAISLISDSFVASFMSVSEELGKIIGAELRSALGITTDGTAIGQGGVNYHIAHVELPNVTDGVGLANFFNDLPAIAQQQVTTK